MIHVIAKQSGLNNLVQFYLHKKIPFMERFAFIPILAMRIWIAEVFFKSGLSKIGYWDGTIGLFEEEYRVPILSPELAAYLATGIELIAPVLLVLGMGARLGALSLLIMTAVIELTYMHFDIHLVWAMLLSLILFQGPGRASLDFYIRRHWEKKCYA